MYMQGPLNGIEAMIGSMEEIKNNKKVLYHFANYAIVNELLIIKNRRKPGLLANASALRDAATLPTRLLDARGVVHYKRQWLRTSGV